ncbi:stage II sporulation protein M [Cellulomonas hominis]
MTGEPVVTGVDRRHVAARALAAALVTTVSGFLVGYLSLRGVVQEAQPPESAAAAGLWTILGRNVGTAALLYSGVCTLGSSSLIAGLLLGGYVGATWAAAVSAVGVAGAGGSIMWYAPVEMLGLAVAAAAGLFPVVAMFARREQVSRRRAYAEALTGSLQLLATAVVLLLIAAFIESLVIGMRT